MKKPSPPVRTPSEDLIVAFCDHLRVSGRSTRTIELRHWLLCKADAELPYGLDQASDEELVGWMYRDDLSQNTKAVYYDTLNAFYGYWAGRPGGLPYNPLDDMPRPRPRQGRPRPVRDDQLAELLARAREPVRTWALIAAYEGARCIEISRLNREDVTPEATYLHGKGGRDAVVPTHPDVWAAVSRLPPGPIARMRDGSRATAKQVSRMASQHFHALDIRVTMHQLRHWYGTQIRRASDLRTAQEALRHADPKTTALYTQVGLDEIRAAVNLLPRFTGRAASAGASRVAAAGRRRRLPRAAAGRAAGRSWSGR